MAELPPAVRSIESEFKDVLGTNLRSLACYGLALRKILILVDKVDAAVLEQLAPTIIKARKDELFVLVATKDDIVTSADVFPVRYLEIKETHRHLAGEDFLGTLEIHDTHIKLRIEQELKQTMFNMRQAYITATIAPRRAALELAEAIRNSHHAFELLRSRCPAAKDLDLSPIELDRPPMEPELRETLSKALDLATRASHLADQWNKP